LEYGLKGKWDRWVALIVESWHAFVHNFVLMISDFILRMCHSYKWENDHFISRLMDLEDISKTDLIGEFNWACIRTNYIHKCCQNNYLQWKSVGASFFILGILHFKMLWTISMTISMATIYTNMAVHCMNFDAIRVEIDMHELQNCICVLLLNLGKVKTENSCVKVL